MMTVFSAVCMAGISATFFLNPSASQEGDGSAERPFRTFAAAQAAVRKAVKDVAHGAGDVVVEIAPGRHFVAEEVLFKRADSGTAERRVVWRAAERGKVRLTGGRDVPALTAPDAAALGRIPAEARSHVLEADLKAAGIDATLKNAALVWGEEFQTMARWPNDGYTGIAAVDWKKDATGKKIRPNGFTYADDRVGTWADERDGWAVGFFIHDWAAGRVRIASVDPATKTLTQVGACEHYGYGTKGCWYGENLLRELDRPGEYQLSAAEGKLRVWPPAGTPARPPQVTVTETLFRFHELSHVAFEGLVFENTRGDAVLGEYSEDVDLTACSFLNVGRPANFKFARRIRIVGCEAHHCNIGGFRLLARGQECAQLIPSECLVENTHVSDYARLALSYNPAVYMEGCGMTIRNCLFHHGPHAAILGRSVREIKILNNEIHSVCRESGEMGAIYFGRDWTLCGVDIVGNYLHDIGLSRNGRNPNRGVMLDDGAAGVTVRSNRFVRVAEGVSLSAVGNHVDRNLFVDNWPAISGWQVWDEPKCYTNDHYTMKSLRDRFHALSVTEEPWKSRYPYLALLRTAETTGVRRDPATNTTVLDNVVVRGPEKSFFWVWKSYATKKGWWTVAGNVRSEDGHEAEKFLPPLSAIGLQPSKDRAVWPVSHAVIRNESRAFMKHQSDNYRPSPDEGDARPEFEF